jgi:hypothetical protein
MQAQRLKGALVPWMQSNRKALRQIGETLEQWGGAKVSFWECNHVRTARRISCGMC